MKNSLIKSEWTNDLSLEQQSTFWTRIMEYLPQPYSIDVRSLALFRILFGALQLFDVYHRLQNGRYDLAWYTSYPLERSYNDPDVKYYDGFLSDLFLFRRGTVMDEIVFFSVYTILTFFLMVGYKCNSRWLLPALWLLYHALIGKNYAGSFGSDQLSGQLYTWLLFLPLSEVWSVDAYLRRRKGIPRDLCYSDDQVKSVACMGLILQIVIMYLGCFFVRTFDTFSIFELHKSDWFWPDFPLVHYCANGSGTYNTWITKIIRENVSLNRFMTFCGFWIETILPPLCFLLNQRCAHWFAIHIFLLHAGIGMILAIPHFYFLGMLIHCIWIPTHVWNSRLGSSEYTALKVDGEMAHYKKTDGDDFPTVKEEALDDEKEASKSSIIDTMKQAVSVCRHSFSFALQCLCFFLLVISFCDEHELIPGWTESASEWGWKYLYFEADWAMWSPGAARVSPFTVIVAHRYDETEEDAQNFNLYKFLRTGEEVPFEGFTDDVLANLTYLYPSTRWENALGDDYALYLADGPTDMSDNLLAALCTFINEDMEKLGREAVDAVEIKVHLRGISPPGSKTRYEEEVDGFDVYFECFD